ncbi:MAG: mechanosensitive ion channel family protein [Ignavibacteriae bacterium]|nr:mechanosensitive ion channel family protein [Ignavibacteriota bacterium]
MNEPFSLFHGMIIPVSIILGSIIVGLLLRGLVGWWVKRIINRLGWSRAAQFSIIIKHPFLYWSILLGIAIAIRYIAVIPWAIPYIVPCLWGGFILLLSQTIARIATQVIAIRSDNTRHAPSSTLILKITQFSIYIIAIVLILNSFGVNIAAIIAALGIGGLALALALQDTLSNIFAGIYITLAGQISVGNFIKISDAKFVEQAEGFVIDISWRTTVLRRLDGNMVVLPNNVLSQATVVNYILPDVLCRVSMKVSVDTSADIALVQKILQEVVSQQENVSSIQIHLFEIHEIAIDFMVFFVVDNPDAQFSIRSEIVKAVMHKFNEEYIMLKSIVNTNGAMLQQFAFSSQPEILPPAGE